MNTWESLEKQKFIYHRQIYMNPQAQHFLGGSIENCDYQIQKIKDVQHLPQIIQLLKGYYNLIPHPGDKEYLDKRISTYEKELIESTKETPKEPEPPKETPKEPKPPKEPKKKEPKPLKEPKTPKEPKPPKETPKEPKPPKEPKKKVSATLKRLVWNTSIGEEIGKTKCLCCKSTDITQMSFHCGHVIAEVNGGELIVSNLKPICQNCNSSMGTKNMNDFMKTFQ